MKLNWKVRIKSKTFWVAVIPAALLFIQAVAAIFGYSLNLDSVKDRLLDLVNAAFVMLAVLGIVVDPTTQGITDSPQALTYTEPKSDLADVYTDCRMDIEDALAAQQEETEG